MTPLERRCRRVVRMLPRAERETRGEEVLGVLMDLSDGRDRPPLAEVAAVAALAVKLRMRERGSRLRAGLSVLAGALVVVAAPLPVPHVLQHLPGLVTSPVMQILGLVLTLVLWLAGAVVWLLGHRRTSVALWAVYAVATVVANIRNGLDYGYDQVPWHLGHVVAPTVLTAAVVAVAVRRGVPAPRPRRVWLLLVPATVAFWVAGMFELVGAGAGAVPPVAATAVGAAGALVAAGWVVTARGRVGVLVPAGVFMALAVVGLVPQWLALTVAVSVVGMLVKRQDAPSTSLVT
ncbi:hypothetical protein [Virgisporangium ochraceum]|uniref:Uncharacterized protein n=1 Tax=Virgisporangium ochraceum TaxID=65505 RepID=A0A8J4A3U2_9ACTN|nr:hypothetical protein [Virgisporangium ochraceum]GIJ73365.1 hypothetical protein Voc01_082820 [Virgisporangium ochraceum]